MNEGYGINLIVALWCAIAVGLVLASLRGLWLASYTLRRANQWPDTAEKAELRLVAKAHLVREALRLLTGVSYAYIGVPLLRNTTIRWSTTIAVLVWSAGIMLVLSLVDQYVKYRILRLARAAGHLP